MLGPARHGTRGRISGPHSSGAVAARQYGPDDCVNRVLIEQAGAGLVIVAHGPVRRAAIHEFRPEGHKTQFFVKAQLVALGGEVEALMPTLARMGHGGFDHGPRHALAAPGAM